MHPYAYSILQGLMPDDYMRRREFCEFLLVKIQENPLFLSRIIWTDESKFSREGIINRKNLHFWADQNPHLVREANFQQKFSMNVFMLVMGNEVRYKIYDENLNSRRYLDILRTTVSDFCENLPLAVLGSCWFQLDGAPAHSAQEVHHELNNMFNDRWIGTNGPWKWPPRSPDLTPLDFYMWGYLKSVVYSTPVHTKRELQERIENAITSLNRGQLLRATTVEVQNRIERCLTVNGGHIEQLR